MIFLGRSGEAPSSDDNLVSHPVAAEDEIARMLSDASKWLAGVEADATMAIQGGRSAATAITHELAIDRDAELGRPLNRYHLTGHKKALLF